MLMFDATPPTQKDDQMKIEQQGDEHEHELQRRAARRHDDRERRPRAEWWLEKQRGSGLALLRALDRPIFFCGHLKLGVETCMQNLAQSRDSIDSRD
jgi:hypothetical protein